MPEPGHLRARLGRLAKRLRTRAGADGGLRLGLAIAVAVTLSFAADYGLDLDRGGRALANLTLLAGLVFLAWRLLVSPLRRSIDELALASLIERHHPRLQSVLSSALAFSSSSDLDADADPSLVARTLAEAESALAAEPHLERDVLAPTWWRRPLLAGLGMLLVGGLLVGAAGNLLGIWARRSLLLADEAWPYPTQLELVGAEDGDFVVARGDDLDLLVHAAGRLPERITLEVAFADGATLVRLVEAGDTPGVFATRLEGLLVDAEIRASARLARSAEGHVRVLARPALVALEVTVEAPAYLGRPPLVASRPATVEVAAGSTLTLAAEFDKAIDSASLRVADVTRPMERRSAERFEGRWLPERSELIELDARDTDGLTPASRPRLIVTVVPDEAPRVELALPGAGAMLAPSAVLPWRLTAVDDHGLVSLGLDVGARPAAAPPREERRDAALASIGALRSEASGTLVVADTGLVPGDRLGLTATASDANTAPGPGIGRSEIFELRIVSVEDLLADLLRRELELRRDLERAVVDQRALVDEVGQAPESPAADALEDLERREAAMARRMAGVAGRARQILAELEINQLAQPDDRTRIVEAIARPLEDVAAGDLRLAVESLAEARRARVAATAPAAVEEALAQGGLHAASALAIMERVLVAMQKQETFAEVLGLLNRILDLHRQAGEAADAERRRRIREILEGEK